MKVARPGRLNGFPSGPVASDDHPAAIHAVSPSARTTGLASMVKLRMRGHTLRHCSRTMLSRPWTAMAQVPKATASLSNMRRPASKSRPRQAVSNSRSHCNVS